MENKRTDQEKLNNGLEELSQEENKGTVDVLIEEIIHQRKRVNKTLIGFTALLGILAVEAGLVAYNPHKHSERTRNYILQLEEQNRNYESMLNNTPTLQYEEGAKAKEDSSQVNTK